MERLATLQCLSQTKALTNYFLNENNKDKIINNNIALKNKSENQLTPCYLELINKLWNKTPSGTKSVSPSNFVQKLNEMNPLFKLGERFCYLYFRTNSSRIIKDIKIKR